MEELVSVALDAVHAASERLRLAHGRAKNVQHKGAVDLVTETDREVEALVVARLRQAFPDHRIIAEEASAAGDIRPPAADEHIWYLDPLDGTTNFAHAVPHFAISLAFAHGTDTLFGTVHDPIKNETFVAHRGAGARLNDEPIRVSRQVDLGEALVATGFPYDRREHTARYVAFFADFLRQARDVRRIGAAALDLCYVACGRFDGFWEWRLHPWDTAAGGLIVQEAGGSISDFRGASFDLFGAQTLASNGAIHDAMVQLLVERLREFSSEPGSELRL